jgi:protein N-terminal methyltransferase
MLDNMTWTSAPDLEFSRSILSKYVTQPNSGLCADLGCGIGRISIHVLSHFFRRIHLVEPVEKFIAKAESDLSAMGVEVQKYNCGAQDWAIEATYDCIWIQWVLMFLTDDDAVALLTKCKDHLCENGLIVVKENTILSNDRRDAVWCPSDHSFSRTLPHMRNLFLRAGLKVDFAKEQPNWSADLVPLYCWVLKRSKSAK